MAKAKTTGLEHLTLSIIAFNGSGYADRESAEAFLDSYIKYTKWKRREKQNQLAITYYNSVLPLAESLLDCVYPTTHKANLKNYIKFKQFNA